MLDVGGTTPDLRPACESHASPTISVEAMIAVLTEAQRRVVELSVDRSSTHSGRGGYNVQIMRALARKGFVTQGKVHTWETDWRFTPAGFFIGARLHRVRLEKACREKSTSALKTWFPDSRGQQCTVIMQELEARGWQWESTSAGWVCVHAPEGAGIAGLGDDGDF